jgi:uncharacterized RDD family membrane protein YckC
LQCPNCGANVSEGAGFCNSCGQRLDSVTAREQSSSPTPWSPATRVSVAYAGFWLRLVAYVIDSLVLGIFVGFAILMPLMQRAGVSADNPWVLFTGQSKQIAAINMLVTMAAWVYWALMESSPWQATLGKKALGLVVTDLEGRRISFARASGRYFGKIISTIILGIGYFMAGFTEKKQTLHDILAGCLVKRKG